MSEMITIHVGDFPLNGVTYPDAMVGIIAGPVAPLVEVWNADGPIATASVEIPGETPSDGCVFIKDWSENAGMVEALECAGIGVRTRTLRETGFVAAREMRLSGLVIEKIAEAEGN